MARVRNYLDPTISSVKRELIDELVDLIEAKSDKNNAFFDIQVNEENPQESRIIANRPGVELFTVELLEEMEHYYDESNDEPFEIHPIKLGGWSKKQEKIRFTELEIIDFKKYQNTIASNEKREFWDAVFNSSYVFSRIALYVLALFGLLAVLRFCAEKL